ncbi:hypothetical protein I4U23_021402 [Adineta vaga]|nr:hypothetical protein I4U23_021402 [Adineta vaga]
MRRYHRLILKWLLLIGIFGILLKKSSDYLVDLILSSSDNIEEKSALLTYEQSLIAWAAVGQQSFKKKMTMDHRKERNDLQLIGAQIIFRHGARTPLFLLPSLEEVIYNNEHIDTYLPSKWDIKLIGRRNNDIVSIENITSGNDDGKHRQSLKSISGLTVRTGQLTAVGEKQLFQLGKTIRSKLIDTTNNGLLSATYDPNYV